MIPRSWPAEPPKRSCLGIGSENLMSLTRHILYKSDLLEVRHVVCRPGCCRAGEVEDPETDTLVLPLRGVFVQHVAPGREILAEPNQALFFAAGRLHRISHPVTDGDDCLALEPSPEGWREALSAEGLRSSGIGTHGLLSAAAMAARTLLWQRLVRGLATPLEAEDVSLALIVTALRTARREEGKRPGREGTRDLRRQQVEGARIALLTQPDRKWTLSALARQVHSSPFHLARIFRDEVSLPVHQYQQRARLARALDLLLETDRELTEIALDLGFSSHSHFTAVFRRLVGLSPSAFRRSAGSREAAEVRNLLIASPTPRR